MDAPDARLMEVLIEAAYAQVERGHFEELYEGFNNCPAWQFGYVEEKGHTDSYLVIDKCNCGIREALHALDIAIELDRFRPKEGWDSNVR